MSLLLALHLINFHKFSLQHMYQPAGDLIFTNGQYGKFYKYSKQQQIQVTSLLSVVEFCKLPENNYCEK